MANKKKKIDQFSPFDEIGTTLKKFGLYIYMSPDSLEGDAEPIYVVSKEPLTKQELVDYCNKNIDSLDSLSDKKFDQCKMWK